MNSKPSSNRTTIAVLVALALAGLGYFYYSGSIPAITGSLTSTDGSEAVGSQVLDLLNQIQSLNIDTTIFDDPGYRTLIDKSVIIPPVDVGRPNPFAPIPGVASPGQ